MNGKKRKLLQLWTIACSKVLEVLAEKGTEVNYLTGFNFSSAEASCSEEKSIHCLLVNPLTDEGKMKYSINARKSWVKLITLAIHEVCHINHNYHDEDFAGALTDLTSEVFSRYGEIIGAMKLVKKFK